MSAATQHVVELDRGSVQRFLPQLDEWLLGGNRREDLGEQWFGDLLTACNAASFAVFIVLVIGDGRLQ